MSGFDPDKTRKSIPDRLAVLDLPAGRHQRALLIGHERIDYADWTTGENSRPAIETLAERTRMGRKSVSIADDDLEAAAITKRTGTHGRARIPVYAFLPYHDGASGQVTVTQVTTNDGTSGQLTVTDDGASNSADGASNSADGTSNSADGASNSADGASGQLVTPTPTKGRGRGRGKDSVSPAGGGSTPSSEDVEFIEALDARLDVRLDVDHRELLAAVARILRGGWTVDAVADRVEARGKYPPRKNLTGLVTYRLNELPAKPKTPKPKPTRKATKDPGPVAGRSETETPDDVAARSRERRRIDAAERARTGETAEDLYARGRSEREATGETLDEFYARLGAELAARTEGTLA